MGIVLSVKAMTYKEIEPCARALGMQLLVLDPKSYQWGSKLKQKFKLLGIAVSEYQRLAYELEDGNSVVVLKSKTYYGTPEIALHFAKFKLSDADIHYMNSVNAEEHPAFGDLDASIPASKRKFFYWIPLQVVDEHDNPVLESK